MLRIILVVAAALAALLGIAYYAISPGVLSYQVSFFLVLPALALALWWLHRHLPMWLQWGAAAVLAPIGPAGYLLLGGSEWWAWGQLTAGPLVWLAIERGYDPAAEPEPWGGGPVEGPWGPP